MVEESARFGLHEEVRTAPKPGLVDCYDSGSHKDMDYMTFKRSIKAIVPYIVEMAHAGLYFNGMEEELFFTWELFPLPWDYIFKGTRAQNSG